MTASRNYIAFDLGAESGRTIAASFTGERFELDVLNRFPNLPVQIIDSLHWDVLSLFRGMKEGLSAYSAKYGREIASIGVDTWGVDFGLLDKQGALLANPLCYRDTRFEAQMEKVFRKISRREVYQKTGIQVMPFNTLFQLHALVDTNSPWLEQAETFLMTPDLLNYFLTGEKAQEFTIATTSQMYNPLTSEWATDILQAVGIPERLFPDITAPGSIVGTLFESIGSDCGVAEAPIVAPGCHDTASAVAAVPAVGDDWMFLSSGTWSLLGVERTEPLINSQSMDLNFTNEGGVDGTFRFLKNISGLWLVQECRRAFQKEGHDYDYATLAKMANDATPFQALIHPDHPPFGYPGEMPQKIAAFCTASGQSAPENHGSMIRTILESLALEYRRTAEAIEKMTERTYSTIHIIGGGTQNETLNQFAADATGKLVKAGPVEATAFGNVLMQAIALGDIGSLAEAREIVRASVEVKTYEPTSDRSAWESAYRKFRSLHA